MRNIRFSRRSLLRGLGYGSVLCTGLTKNLYAQTRVTRLAMFGYANGSHPDSNPTGMGNMFVLKPHMAPLEAVRNDIVVTRGMTLERGSGNSHKSTSFSIFGLGAPTSIDQTIADFVASTTPLKSFEYSIGNTGGGGGVIPGLSQRSGSFIPGVRNPVAAYSMVASRVTGGAPPPGNGPGMSTPTQAEQALMRRQTLLDFVKKDVDTYRSRLGATEKAKLDFYTESLRSLERGVGDVIPAPSASCMKITAPAATLTADTHVNDMPIHNHLYMDIIAMAFACNITRVASGMWGGGQSDESIKIGNVSMGDWHSTSHMDPKGSGGQQMINLQAFMASELLYLVQKLKTYKDGMNGLSVLDNSAVVLTTQNGCSTQVAFAPMDHPKQNSPLIVAGSCGGAWKTGRVIDFNGRTHVDVYLSIAQAFGMKVTTVGNPAWCKGPILMGG